MLKAKRFMIEYANYQIKKLEDDQEMNAGIKAELIRRIDRSIWMYTRGYITVDETMRIINSPAKYDEDLSEYATA